MRLVKLLTIVLLLVTLFSAAAVAGCSDDRDSQNPGTTTTDGTGSGGMAPAEDPTSEELPDPGFHEQDDGTVQAIGIFVYRDLEGGFWAVVDANELEDADDADILAILGSSEHIPGPVSSYENSYVSITGTPTRASVYQAGPFVEVSGIRMLKKLIAE
jgi:hypothetical protein